MERNREIFDALYELRAYADKANDVNLQKAVTEAENVTMQEILNLKLAGNNLGYQQIWSRSFAVYNANRQDDDNTIR